jgi:hypothetical protein
MPHTWSKTYIDSIRGLTLEILNRQIEAYTNGFLADFALTCDAMQERDDVLKNVIAKRKKAVARHGWEVLALDNSPEARAHQQALEYFYGHLRCSSVLKQNENGGFGLLVTQMLVKHFPLQSWLDYCQKYGSPGIQAVTTAARDTPEWDAMTLVLDQFIRELAVVTNANEDIKLLDLKGAGAPPYIALVERMDRVMIALWRGADLGTLSRNQGYGASLQGEESRVLEVDDAKLISETLNNTLDRQVIKILFGQTTEPLAYINILVSPQDYTTQDLAIDQFLTEHGVPLSQARALQRYNRVPVEAGEPILETSRNRTGDVVAAAPRRTLNLNGKPRHALYEAASAKSLINDRNFNHDSNESHIAEYDRPIQKL